MMRPASSTSPRPSVAALLLLLFFLALAASVPHLPTAAAAAPAAESPTPPPPPPPPPLFPPLPATVAASGTKGKLVLIDFAALLPQVCNPAVARKTHNISACVIVVKSDVENGDLFVDSPNGHMATADLYNRAPNNVFRYMQDPFIGGGGGLYGDGDGNGGENGSREDDEYGYEDDGGGQDWDDEMARRYRRVYRTGSPFDTFDVAVLVTQGDTAAKVESNLGTVRVEINIVNQPPRVGPATMLLPPAAKALRLPPLKAIDDDRSIKNSDEIQNTTIIGNGPCCGWSVRTASAEMRDDPMDELEGQRFLVASDGAADVTSFNFVAYDTDDARSPRAATVAVHRLNPTTNATLLAMRPAVFRTLVLCSPPGLGTSPVDDGTDAGNKKRKIVEGPCYFSLMASDFLGAFSSSTAAPSLTASVALTSPPPAAASGVLEFSPENDVMFGLDSKDYFVATNEASTLQAELMFTPPPLPDGDPARATPFSIPFDYEVKITPTPLAATGDAAHPLAATKAASGRIVRVDETTLVCGDIRVEPVKFVHVAHPNGDAVFESPMAAESPTLLALLGFNITLNAAAEQFAPDFSYRAGSFRFIVAGIDTAAAEDTADATSPDVRGVFFNLKLQRVILPGDEIDEVDVAFVPLAEYLEIVQLRHAWTSAAQDPAGVQRRPSFLPPPPGSRVHTALRVQAYFSAGEDEDVSAGRSPLGVRCCNEFKIRPPRGPLDDVAPPRVHFWATAPVASRTFAAPWRASTSVLDLNALVARRAFCVSPTAGVSARRGRLKAFGRTALNSPSQQIFRAIRNGYVVYPVARLHDADAFTAITDAQSSDSQQEPQLSPLAPPPPETLALLVQDFETRGRLHFELHCDARGSGTGAGAAVRTAELVVDLQKRDARLPTIRRMGPFCSPLTAAEGLQTQRAAAAATARSDPRKEWERLPTIHHAGLRAGTEFEQHVTIDDATLERAGNLTLWFSLHDEDEDEYGWRKPHLALTHAPRVLQLRQKFPEAAHRRSVAGGGFVQGAPSIGDGCIGVELWLPTALRGELTRGRRDAVLLRDEVRFVAMDVDGGVSDELAVRLTLALFAPGERHLSFVDFDPDELLERQRRSLRDGQGNDGGISVTTVAGALVVIVIAVALVALAATRWRLHGAVSDGRTGFSRVRTSEGPDAAADGATAVVDVVRSVLKSKVRRTEKEEEEMDELEANNVPLPEARTARGVAAANVQDRQA